MSNALVILVGGILPAFFWGVTAIFQKLSAQHSTGAAVYLGVFGLVIGLAGCLASLIWRESAWTGTGVCYAALAGLTFAVGTGLISVALAAYDAPLSKLAPLWSCNVLVTIAISAVFLGEASRLNVTQVALGTVLIIAGALLVTSA